MQLKRPCNSNLFANVAADICIESFVCVADGFEVIVANRAKEVFVDAVHSGRVE